MKHRTSIQVEKETRLRLDKIKLAKRESKDEMVNRLLDNYEMKENKINGEKENEFAKSKIR